MSLKDILHKKLSSLKKSERYVRLREFWIFEGLSNYELSFVDELFYSRKYSAGEILYEKGFPVELVYLIVSGEVQLQETGQSFGTNQVLDLSSLFWTETRPYTAVAVVDTEVMAISQTDFDELIKKEKSLGVKVLKNICTRLTHIIHDKPC
ncbi:MAG TPA: cyclic nucleotide-binding domain-containing protein [Candidatus Cloacimonetes bacterium]|jgi:CRP-like cAMP-binding protein|nr:hypothetical protein [Candidatus Cloacimonas sp.]HHZ14855.1 cyclic nucleotide-binding domain-containing protein [Candidatus Cloacimonadota bacterium]